MIEALLNSWKRRKEPKSRNVGRDHRIKVPKPNPAVLQRSFRFGQDDQASRQRNQARNQARNRVNPAKD